MIQRLALALLTVVALTAPAAAQEGWRRLPPSEAAAGSWKPLAGRRVYLVPPERQGEAEPLLASQPVVEVEPEQAAYLTGAALAASAGTRPYLARAIACHVGGSFPVFQAHDGALWVQHLMTQSEGQQPQEHRAVVVLLERMPSEAYASCLRRR